jgi:hypothetical protein
LNQRPSGYEPDELPGCSTPRHLSEHCPRSQLPAGSGAACWSATASGSTSARRGYSTPARPVNRYSRGGRRAVATRTGAASSAGHGDRSAIAARAVVAAHLHRRGPGTAPRPATGPFDWPVQRKRRQCAADKPFRGGLSRATFTRTSVGAAPSHLPGRGTIPLHPHRRGCRIGGECGGDARGVTRRSGWATPAPVARDDAGHAGRGAAAAAGVAKHRAGAACGILANDGPVPDCRSRPFGRCGAAQSIRAGVRRVAVPGPFRLPTIPAADCPRCRLTLSPDGRVWRCTSDLASGTGSCLGNL